MKLRLSFRMQRSRLRLLVLLGSLLVAAGLIAAASQSPAATPVPGLTAVSAPWSAAVTLSDHDVGVLELFSGPGLSLKDVHILASRFGRAYYRIDNTLGADCYGLGIEGEKDALGAVGCAPNFPSAAQPVLDLTGFRGHMDDPSSARITRSEGFAADGIAEIAFRTAGGTIVGAVPVVDNVYVVQDPPSEQVVALVARNESGAIVWTQDYSGVSASG